MCGLEAFADAVVGSLGVEHKKRTTIAVELAAKVCAYSTRFFEPLNLASDSPNFFFSLMNLLLVSIPNLLGP